MVIFHCYVSSPEGSFSLEYIVVIGEKRKIQAPADPESVELRLNCVEFKHVHPVLNWICWEIKQLHVSGVRLSWDNYIYKGIMWVQLGTSLKDPKSVNTISPTDVALPYLLYNLPSFTQSQSNCCIEGHAAFWIFLEQVQNRMWRPSMWQCVKTLYPWWTSK